MSRSATLHLQLKGQSDSNQDRLTQAIPQTASLFFALTPVIRLNSCVDFNAGSTSSTCAEAADVQVSAPENFKLSSQVGNTLQIQELNRYPNVVNSRHDQSLVHLPGAGVSGILLTARFKSVSASFCFASRSSWQHQVLCGPNRSQT